MSARQAGGRRGPTASTVAARSQAAWSATRFYRYYERSRYLGQLKVSCRMAGNVRTAGEPGPVYPAGKAVPARTAPRRRGAVCHAVL